MNKIRSREINNSLNDIWARLIGVPILTALLIIFGSAFETEFTLKLFLVKIFKNFVYVLVYWESTRYLFYIMRRKYPLLKDTAFRIGFQFILITALILTFGMLIAIFNVYLLGDRDLTFLPEYRNIIVKSSILLTIVTILYECAYFFGGWKNSLYESELLKKENLISQFEMLKSQISPHFLFNSLNALSALVPEDPVMSVLFIQRLSNVYRNVLSHNESNIIDLNSELKFLDDYIFLNKIRFGNNLSVLYQLPETILNLQVIPFTLQLLVENAIKHNIISNKKPLLIQITIVGNRVLVINNLQKKTSGVESTHLGLGNIINRYQLLTGNWVEIIETSTSFTVSIPLIFSNISL